MNWAEHEMASVNLGDKRLNRRAATLLNSLAKEPAASIPEKSEDLAEMTAAYRFIDNDRVDDQKILAPHRQCTIERMREHETVLCIEDTTEIDYTTQHKASGLGRLNKNYQRGMYLHPMIAATTEGTPLGILSAQLYTRALKPKHKKKIAEEKVRLTFEEKESYRWFQGYQNMNELAKIIKSQLIYIADREGDIDELLTAAQNQPGKLLIRARHNRIIDDDDKMFDLVMQSPVIGHEEFDMEARPGRKARTVRQELRALEVLLPPNNKRDKAIAITVVIATEVNPPPDEEPVTWRILTTLKVSTAEDAIRIIRYYRCRWIIEIYFKVLKSGCNVEALQLETCERLKTAIALYVIIAYRVLFMTRQGRETPDIPCDAIIEDEEWKVAFTMETGKPPPKVPPKLGEMVVMIAKIGGFIGRKCDGFPGPKTIWQGLRNIRIYFEIARGMAQGNYSPRVV